MRGVVLKKRFVWLGSVEYGKEMGFGVSGA